MLSSATKYPVAVLGANVRLSPTPNDRSGADMHWIDKALLLQGALLVLAHPVRSLVRVGCQ